MNLILLGASAGGVKAVRSILKNLPPNPNFALVILIHMNPDLDISKILEVWNYSSKVTIEEARINNPIQQGKAYLAPPDYHLLLESDGRFSLSKDDKVNYCRPSIDVLFESAVLVEEANLTAILLTGANEDGAQGLGIIEKHGGTVIVQDPGEAEVKAMPMAGLRATKNAKTLLLKDIIRYLKSGA